MIPVVRQLLRRGIRLFGYFNNHYAGYAPGSVDLFRKTWDRTNAQESKVES